MIKKLIKEWTPPWSKKQKKLMLAELKRRLEVLS